MTALTLVRKTLGVTVAHSFFAYPDTASGADIEFASQVVEPREGWRCDEFSTLLIALEHEESELWEQIKPGCRQEIRRARDRDNLVVEVHDAPGPGLITEFLAFYDASARRKGIGRADLAALERLASGGGLALGRVASADGPDLAWHAYIVAAGRARLLHSAIRREESGPQSAALRGRANRLLHWNEICHFRDRGLHQYDFGGLALGGGAGRLAGIDAFKQTFGGEIAKEYKCRRGASSVGRLALGLADAGARAREGAARLRGMFTARDVSGAGS